MAQKKKRGLFLKEIFRPNLQKTVLFIILGFLLWFFPVVTSSIYAAPFINFENFTLALLINAVIAYLLSHIIISNLNNKKVLLATILIFLVIYLAIPKISYYSVGDIGGVSKTYCECYGYETRTLLKCCYSSASYCNGPCLRNEKQRYWKGYN